MRALALSAALLASTPAWAVFACGDQTDVCQCGANNPYPCCDNGGNCTWWAWEAACCNWKVALPGWGNANQWVGNANANGGYAVLGSPVTNAISCRTLGTYGHVAWVTAVTGPNISVTEENCFGNYGMRAANYSASFFQGFITQKGQTECAAGDSQTQGCGTCGTHSRGCGTNGKWGAWGSCGGQGPCAPGATQSQACGTCGTRERSCGGNCQWGAFPTACAGPDPDGGAAACDTGHPGPCAPGVMRCTEGELTCTSLTAPKAEVCDQVDNDCNGQVDDGISCGPHLLDAPFAVSTPRPAPPPDATGSCATTPKSAAVWLTLGVALWFARRRVG